MIFIFMIIMFTENKWIACFERKKYTYAQDLQFLRARIKLLPNTVIFNDISSKMLIVKSNT